MRIIIEEYKYAASEVKDVLKGIDALENVEGYVCVNYVGYFYNTDVAVRDCVFILPKVLLEDKGGKELVFGKYTPEEIINLDAHNPLTQKEKDFIYEFAVWIYRTIVVFQNDKLNNTSIVYHRKIGEVGKGGKHLSNTFLDILLSLVQFNKNNKDFFFYILRNIHAGFNKINWNRTISTTTAFVQDNHVVYLHPVNKKRQINFDEELLIIFFSILNYISEHYGFPVDIKCHFELITGRQFKVYLNGLGKVRLKQIKYKYFSDKALELWDLCFAFFDAARQIYVSTEQKEYLLVKNFNIVFEAIIDELVGDRNIPAGLKEQDDGKRIDHMYSYQGLTTHEEDKPIYYIGDSKYYKRGNQIGKEAVYKQFTYARNVIQWNLNLFMNDDRYDEELQYDKKNFGCVPKLRDDVTEGYNVIPNFFISARLNKDLSYKDEIEITDKRNTHFTNSHFDNRLFDRDTLLICHYDVNFLYVISLYARNNSLQKVAWKKIVRDRFREQIQQMLAKKYDFYAMKSIGNPLVGGQFIKSHFQDFLGKIYRPYDDKNIFSMALEKKDGVDNSQTDIYQMLSEYFVINKVNIGENPQEELYKAVAQYESEKPYTPVAENLLPKYHLERFKNEYVVIGTYHGEEHWNWITGKNDKGSLIYNVRLGKERDGSQVANRIRKLKPKFAILLNEKKFCNENYRVFRIHDTAIMTEKRMQEAHYPGKPNGSYFIFRFDDEMTIGEYNVVDCYMEHQNKEKIKFGTPMFVTCDELLKYKIKR